ncbi:MAG: amino acid ABC transporter permease [Proteobacteria bacterium]|nr:amino acid ABC transporter permease [Pseudomonadota bacterium]
MNYAVVWDNWRFLAEGLSLTLQTAVLVIVGGSILGISIGLVHTAHLPGLKQLAVVYIELIRGTPLLVVLFLVYFGFSFLAGHRLSAYQAAVGGFVVFIGAYIAEDFRSGVHSIPRGQIEAGVAAGLSRVQVLRLIVVPLALRRMTPALFGQFVRLLKFSSVASVIGVTELTGATLLVNAREFRPIELLSALAVTYFVLCVGLSLIGRRLNERFKGRI